MSGQFDSQKDSEKAGPNTYMGISIKLAEKRRSIMLNNKKINLNFNSSSFIIVYHVRIIVRIIVRIYGHIGYSYIGYIVIIYELHG